MTSKEGSIWEGQENKQTNNQKPLGFHRKSEIARVLLQTFDIGRVYFLCAVRL